MKTLTYTEYDKERMVKEKHKKGDKRNPFQIDRDRIIHSSAFRRLQGKTQVYGAGLMDFYRTRLTHSIEVSQIAKSIGLKLKVNVDLLEAISLAHDIGHPPFGHTGEEVLNRLLSRYGGFEANAHNILILGFLETKIEDKGLNLTRATLDGLLKYKTTRNKNSQKFLYEYDFFRNYIEWIDPSWQDDKNIEDKRSIECQIVNWADNSAYSVHDLEDGLKSGLLNSEKLNDKLLEKISQNLKEYNPRSIEKIFYSLRRKINQIESTSSHVEKKRLLKKLTSDLINEFVKDVYIDKVESKKEKTNRYSFKLRLKTKTLLKNRILREIEKELIYKSKNILRTRKKCEMMVEKIFDIFSDKNSKQLYPPEYQEYWDLFNADREEEWRYRLASWYIAGMTDNFAIRTYKEFFDPNNLIDIFMSV
ncbi:MAG: deoxyguanosinetriphosphate triphosphohydrolase family protein [Brevinematia bacterium]